ncbi:MULTISPECIES: phage holin family protein [unclassified Corynebacterium]|uniref:phage holin family protein n=1 Tax=unclassified Corynebacterium TaxID=2624378 RepID=UPI0029CA7AEE|nr:MULTISPECIES: phage holin family protein [unclassified Corynebacterium]WPF66206.1 phage holin family protein [Corynebacterium sp. 22KM0430]WPF68697.1 phage holin family protein [Corynebacterium sp. 21KM1197]
MSGLWNFLVRAAGTAVALWAVTQLIAGVSIYGATQEDRLIAFLGSAALIVALNMTVRPVLRLIGLPLTILSLGFFALIINAGVFLFAGSLSEALGLGLTVDSFRAAFWGALVMGLVNWLLGPLTGALRVR